MEVRSNLGRDQNRRNHTQAVTMPYTSGFSFELSSVSASLGTEESADSLWQGVASPLLSGYSLPVYGRASWTPGARPVCRVLGAAAPAAAGGWVSSSSTWRSPGVRVLFEGDSGDVPQSAWPGTSGENVVAAVHALDDVRCAEERYSCPIFTTSLSSSGLRLSRSVVC